MSAGGFKQAPLHAQLKLKAASVDQHLQSCVAVLESSTLVSFWPTKRKHEAVTLLKREREDIQIILNELVDVAQARGAEADTLMSRLVHADQELREAQVAKDAAEASLQQARDAAAQERRQQSARIRALQKQVQELREQRDELAAAQESAAAAAAVQDAAYLELLAGLEAEMTDLRTSTATLLRTKEMAYLQLRELASSYQNSATVAEREVRRLQIELKKAEKAHEELATANKESAEALNARGRQLRTTQQRCNSIKSVADATKDTAVGLRRQLEEAVAAQARTAEAAEAQGRRLAETRAARDSLAAELEALRREYSALHDAFVAAGGVEHQIAAWRAAVAAGSVCCRAGRPKCRAAVVGGAGYRPVSMELPRASRIAMRVRTGWCLHGRPCGAAQDSTKLALIPYSTPGELEAAIRDQRLFLCTSCLKDGAF